METGIVPLHIYRQDTFRVSDFADNSPCFISSEKFLKCAVNNKSFFDF